MVKYIIHKDQLFDFIFDQNQIRSEFNSSKYDKSELTKHIGWSYNTVLKSLSYCNPECLGILSFDIKYIYVFNKDKFIFLNKELLFCLLISGWSIYDNS